MLMGVTGASAPRCQCVDDLFAPIKSKMKVLKKFKKKMGFAPRSGSSSGTNNLPPILFHQVHGDNIRLSRDGTVARRAESFCKGVTFSSRPIKVSEKVCVKFLEVSNNWSGVIRFGFTCNDPNNLRNGLPKYACPDLTNKPGYWAKALAERFAERDTVLFYYVTHAGDVHFGVNGEEKGIFFSGVETRGPLWAIMDVYGNSTAIELVDPRQQLNNSRRNLLGNGDGSPDAPDQIILPGLSSLNIRQPQNHHNHNQANAEEAEQAIRRVRHSVNFSPLCFHGTSGRNVCLNNDRTVATRTDTEFCHGYVFTSRPIHLGERIVIQVLATEPMYLGALAFGLTACDPSTIQGHDLPDDSEALLDRSEYWVISKDVANSPLRGDELSFCVTPFGEVQFSRNGSTPVVVMHVDHTLRLWAFFDVYGSTQKIRILGSVMDQPPAPVRAPRNSPPPRVVEPAINRLRVNLPCTTTTTPSEIPTTVVPARLCCTAQVPVTTSELVHYPTPGCGGGTVLVVNLPPAHASYLSQQNQQNQLSTPLPPIPSPAPAPTPTNHHQPTTSSGTLMSTYSHTYIEPISSSYSTMDSTTSMQQWIDASSVSSGTECTICYERPIDSVLYMCGHMCMCYECAVQQWRGKGGGHCPLCRAVIRDVIRTYKS